MRGWVWWGFLGVGGVAVIGIGGWVKSAKSKMKGKTLPPAA